MRWSSTGYPNSPIQCVDGQARLEEHDEFHEEHETWAPTSVSIVATHLQDDNGSSDDERFHDEAYRMRRRLQGQVQA